MSPSSYCPPRGSLAILALIFVLLEPGIVNSNATGFTETSPDGSVPVSRIQGTGNPVLRRDPESKAIDTLLQTFKVNSSRRGRVVQAIMQSSRKHNLDSRLVASIIVVESRGNPFAISGSKAVGIMQVHVPTWARIVDEEGIDLFKIEDNVDFGSRILRDYVNRYGRDEGVRRYMGWRPGDAESIENAEGYLRKVLDVYHSRPQDRT